MPAVVLRHEAIQYDGTNGAYIADEWLDDATVVSDTGDLLRLRIGGWTPVTYDIPRHHYVLRYYGKQFFQPVPPADYVRDWVEIPGT